MGFNFKRLTGPLLSGILLTLLLVAAAHAQTQVVLGNSAVELTGPWKFHTGDNMSWADPNFDDSAWSTMDLTPTQGSNDPNSGTSGYVPGWAARGYAGYSGYAWYRLRIHLQNNTGGTLALKMPEDVDDAYQVYVNGRFLGALGHFTPHGVSFYYSQPLAFPLPPSTRSGPLTIAIRMWMDISTPEHAADYGGLHGPPVLGMTPSVDSLLRLNWDAINHGQASNFLEIALQLLALLIVFVLYWLDPSEPAYPWLGLSCAMSLIFVLLMVVRSHTTWLSAAPVDLFLFVVLLLGQIVVWVHFWGAWFRLGRTPQTVWLYRSVWVVVLLLAAATAALMPPFYGGVVPIGAAASLPFVIPIVRPLVAALLLWVAYLGIRKNRTEGLLALPALLLLAVGQTPALEIHSMHMRGSFFLFGIWFPLNRIATFTSLGIITVLMLRRFLQSQRQREQLKQEIEQARHVQRLLVPLAAPATPGYSVETVYLPASEVGGDFFQVLPGDDESLLVVVGDVSGKGLKAAMTVSTIIGALRGCALRPPAEVLAYLNRVLHGQIEGFATCSVALISAGGELTLANAGHLAPYRDGEELEVAGGLPLGILPQGEYEEAHYQLAPGDRLTFVSDGVVEATNDKRELFGFDRTRKISRQTAQAIAQMAQRFGQQDDITVVTVEFAGAREAVSA